MPFIKIQSSITSAESTAVEELLKSLSSKLAKHLGKPEFYVMTAFEPGIKMSFAGTFEPVCYVEIKSIGKMNSTQTQAMSKDFCQQIQERLGVNADRIYIEFSDAERTMWGWNGSTF
jgi:phenylpyruvate tautomerase